MREGIFAWKSPDLLQTERHDRRICSRRESKSKAPVFAKATTRQERLRKRGKHRTFNIQRPMKAKRGKLVWTSSLTPAFSPRRGGIDRRHLEIICDWISPTLIRKTRNNRMLFPLLGERIKGEGGRALCTAIRQSHSFSRGFFKAMAASLCSAGFQTCCIADFQVGRVPVVVPSAGLETRDTADLEVCATGVAATPRCTLCG
jgi:hypothetical protein